MTLDFFDDLSGRRVNINFNINLNINLDKFDRDILVQPIRTVIKYFKLPELCRRARISVGSCQFPLVLAQHIWFFALRRSLGVSDTFYF